ncbi:MAG: TonB-dependent receptor [Acidobacteriota bacterium]
MPRDQGAAGFPVEYADIHFSVSRETRFATMKELYSASDGNPDLQDEIGTDVEVGFAYDKQVRLSSAIFYNSFKDLINSVRRPDGSKYYENIDRARISGFELEAGKPIRWLDLSANYTYLNARNQDTDKPLDLVPGHQFNFMLNGRPGRGFSFAVWGLATSECTVASSSGTLKAPGYFVAGASVDKTLSVLRLFLRADNLFNKSYVTIMRFTWHMAFRSVALNPQMKG